MRFFKSLQYIFRPGFWLRIHPYSHGWDVQLRTLMETNRFERHRNHTAKIGGVVVWISNYPYGAFRPDPQPEVMPARDTVELAMDRYLKDISEAHQ